LLDAHGASSVLEFISAR